MNHLSRAMVEWAKVIERNRDYLTAGAPENQMREAAMMALYSLLGSKGVRECIGVTSWMKNRAAMAGNPEAMRVACEYKAMLWLFYAAVLEHEGL